MQSGAVATCKSENICYLALWRKSWLTPDRSTTARRPRQTRPHSALPGHVHTWSSCTTPTWSLCSLQPRALTHTDLSLSGSGMWACLASSRRSKPWGGREPALHPPAVSGAAHSQPEWMGGRGLTPRDAEGAETLKSGRTGAKCGLSHRLP